MPAALREGSELSQTTTAAESWLALFDRMLVIRLCEEQLARSHQRGLIHGACHTYVGEEAIATGVCAHLRTDDVVFSTHRGHGHALAKGLPPRELIAELYGRETGCSRGRGGSMHIFAPEIGMMGTSGIVGPCILQAAGAGYASRVLGLDRVAVAFFGDGAVNNGAFHEGLNMAGLWKLPVLFVCENNQFATEVPFNASAANTDVASRGASYGMPGLALDGNDVLGISSAAAEAVARARAGEGPTLLECRTYRTRAHAEGMGDFTYRTRDEVDEWRKRCPIARLRERIVAAGLATDEDLRAREASIAALIAEAETFAAASRPPDPATATTHVYSAVPAAPASPLRHHPPGPGTREITYGRATWEALSEEMARHPEIFVMGEGIGVRGGNFRTTEGLFQKYGALRLRDTPISERGFVGLAGGAAMTGARPVVDFMFADFIMDSIGEVVNQIAKMQYMSSGRLKMPVLLRGCIGIGHSAATHHSGNYYPLYAHFPGLRVLVPSTPYDAKGLMKRALNCDDPVLFLEHRELLNTRGPVPDEEYEIEFGRAVVTREGADLTIVAIAQMARRALEAAEQLAGEGISIEVVDPRTVSPLDTETILRSVHKTGRLLVVDEAYGPFGFASEIAAHAAGAAFDDLDAPVRRLFGAFSPTPYSPSLEQAVVPALADIVQAARQLARE